MPPRAVLQALDLIWAALEPLEISMALMGGLALSVWKHVRATQDVDLLVGLGETSIDDVLVSATKAGFRPKRTPPTLSLGSFQVLQLEFEPQDAFIAVQVDLLLVDLSYHHEALSRRVPINLPDVKREVCVLACEDLVLHKLLAGRIIDLADCAALLRVNRETLDLNYLTRWTKELHLEVDLRRVWEEAFPGGEATPI